jgi:hypothetical protein
LPILALDISPVDDVCIVEDLPDLICDVPIEAYFFVLFFLVLVVVFCLDTSTGVGFNK